MSQKKENFGDYIVGEATGVSTGSFWGGLGAEQHRLRKERERGQGRPTFSGPSKALSPWLDDVFDCIPSIVRRALIALAGLIGLVIGAQQGVSGVELASCAVAGAICGALVLPLVKVALKLSIFILKLAILAAILYGIYALIVANS